MLNLSCLGHETDWRKQLLTGTAEIFGTELIQGPTYTFTGTKSAIFTHHGCTIETSNDAPQSEYTAEETLMSEYVNVHFALETLRNEAQVQGKHGPRVLVLGPSNAGKTSLLKLLTAYATRLGRQPIVINLDPEEGMLSLPGTLSAAAIKTLLDVEAGWGSSPMSGPSPIPVKLPLVYNYALADPIDDDASASHYKCVVSKLALAVSGRLSEDTSTKSSGLLIDTPGTLANTTKPLAATIIQHIVSEFAVSHILVLGSERLYSDMLRRFESHPTSASSSSSSSFSSSTRHHPNELLTVSKLSKSGGCIDRDNAFMRALRAAQTRAYFFGTSTTTQSSSLINSNGSGSSSGINLSPRQQQVDFDQLAIYQLLPGDKAATANSLSADHFRPGGQDDDAGDDDDDPYTASPDHPTNHPAVAGSKASRSRPAILHRLHDPIPALQSHCLAVMNAAPDAAEREIHASSVLGFVYVAEVDVGKGRLALLTPVPGRVPDRALVWGPEWPEEVVGVV
jgi:polyribonucleotide 5'-hydroxyl-kinase